MLCTPCNHRGWLFFPNFSLSISPIQGFTRVKSSLMCTANNLSRPPSFAVNPISFTTWRKPNSFPLSHVNSLERGDSIGETDPVRVKWAYKERLRNYSYLLQACASKGVLICGKAVHGNLIRSGLEPDSHLWTCLVNMYAKCGRFNSARYLLDTMPLPDVVSWTALIAGLVSDGNGFEAINLYRQMSMIGVLPNGFTFATVLKACSMCLVLEFGKQLHGQVIKLGFLSDVYVGSALVDLYAKCGEVVLAANVFSCMPEQNAVSWNALLNGYSLVGNSKQVLKLFGRMTESETKFSKYTLSSVLKACASSGNVKEGRGVHSLVVKIGTELDNFLSSSLVDMYSKCGVAKDAYNVFARIRSPDLVSWSAIIACLDQQGYHHEAANLFIEMRRTGIRPNQYTLASLVCTATALGNIQYGNSIHAHILRLGFESDTSVSNALVAMYMKSGSVEDGQRVFEAITEQDLLSWNSLLSGFHDEDYCHQGPSTFIQMLVKGYNPNKYTYISVLRSCSSLEDTCFGKQLHGHIVKNNLDKDCFVGTALVDMYAKCGCFEDAHTIFQGMKERDVFTWTVMITGFTNVNQGEKSMKYYRQMQREGLYPNEFTLASCLRACTGIAALENGQQIHSRIIKAGQSIDPFIMSALVDMYGKCGCIYDAETVFNSMVTWDTVTWNTIICAYSQHGQGERALEAFTNMIDEGVTPDEITFIGVLSACSHVGLIEEGRKHFCLMSKVYGITPTLKHYACMVDILCRAGKFDDVETLIANMNYTPDSSIWLTILGACTRHGNVEFAEIAAEKLFELEPQMDSTYILLSNLYAAKGWWSDVAKIRERMSRQGVKKEPGCSWVVINGQVHVFLPKDISHPSVNEIYKKLDEVGLQLKSAGYTPDTGSVLHNVSDGEKKESLLYHSERLALAFCLISMQPGKPIRIFKNLRICGDCHNAMKIFSGITDREIIIRDISRFHHFQNGSCSCHDYW